MYEIAIMTRSSPAKILGLEDRGSLKPGCIADISIYNPKSQLMKCLEVHHMYLKMVMR